MPVESKAVFLSFGYSRLIFIKRSSLNCQKVKQSFVVYEFQIDIA